MLHINICLEHDVYRFAEAGTCFKPDHTHLLFLKPGFETIIKLGLLLELLSAIVKLGHLQPSCWFGSIVDFCFVGSYAENLR